MMLRALFLIFLLSALNVPASYAQNEGIVDVPPLPPAEPEIMAPAPDFSAPQPVTPEPELTPLPPDELPPQEAAPIPTETTPAVTAEPPAATTDIPATETTPPPATPKDTVSSLLQEPVESAKGGFEPSYGQREHSLFFSKTTADNIRHILRLYESGSLDKAQMPEDAGIAELLQDLQPKEQQKQLVYPRFKLRSVIYRSPAEWVILLNENRISSYNNSSDREITVLNVNKSTASFRWKPTDEMLLAAIGRDASIRQRDGNDASNRTAKGMNASFDDKARSVFFSLSVNQDFDSRTFEIMEGGLAAPKPAPVVPPAAEAAPAATMAPATSPAPAPPALPNVPAGAPQAPAPADATQSGTSPPAAGSVPAPLEDPALDQE